MVPSTSLLCSLDGGRNLVEALQEGHTSMRNFYLVCIGWYIVVAFCVVLDIACHSNYFTVHRRRR